MPRKTTKTEKTAEKATEQTPVAAAARSELVPNQPASDETRPNRTPSHEQISRRAYELWAKRGGVGGNAQEDWLRAEQELRARP